MGGIGYAGYKDRQLARPTMNESVAIVGINLNTLYQKRWPMPDSAPSTNCDLNLREWACIAQGGHRTGNALKMCRRESAGLSEFWHEYQCVACGVWVINVASYTQQSIDNRFARYQEQEYVH